MTTEAYLSRRLVLMACGALAVVMLLLGCGTSVARNAYIEQNLALLQDVPAFPGSRPVGVDSSGYKDGESDLATTAGYGTTREYSIRRMVRATTVIEFYRRALRNRWRLLQDYAGFQLNFRQGDAYLEVFAVPGHVDVKIDHDCFKGGSTPVCFGP